MNTVPTIPPRITNTLSAELFIASKVESRGLPWSNVKLMALDQQKTSLLIVILLIKNLDEMKRVLVVKTDLPEPRLLPGE